MLKAITCFLKKIVSLSFILISFSAQGSVHFSLLGSMSDNNFILTQQDIHSISGSVAFDMGSYLRAGFTSRLAINQVSGYRYDDAVSAYVYNQEKSRNLANSVDLTIILYYGDLFVPYLQVGMVKKEIEIYSLTGDTLEHNKYSLKPLPYAGSGLGIRLNKNFSLKISYTLSPGKQLSPNFQVEEVLDSFTSVGISYNTT